MATEDELAAVDEEEERMAMALQQQDEEECTAMALQQQDGSRKCRSSSFRQSTLNSYFGENKATSDIVREEEEYCTKLSTKRMKPTIFFNFESDEFRMWSLDWYRHQTSIDSSSLSYNNKSTKKKSP